LFDVIISCESSLKTATIKMISDIRLAFVAGKRHSTENCLRHDKKSRHKNITEKKREKNEAKRHTKRYFFLLMF
jgi:hypothetical protein